MNVIDWITAIGCGLGAGAIMAGGVFIALKGRR